MKKLSIATLVAIIIALLVATAAFALFFTNGNFETEPVASWPAWNGAGQREFLKFTGGYDATGFPNLSGTGADLSVIVGGPAVAALSISDPNTGGILKYPAVGHYSARVNSQDSWNGVGNGKNANTLYQTTTVDAADIDASDGKVHLRLMYAAVMVEPSPAHLATETPMFFLEVKDVTTGTVLVHKQSYVGESGVPWQTTAIAGGTTGVWKFLDWTYVDVIAGDGSGPASIIGHTLSVKIVATGCSLGGHPGYVYVDEVGSAHVGVPAVTATGPATRVTGSTITYTYNYFNGSSGSINPTIKVTPPTGVTFTTADPACTANGSGGFDCAFTGVGAGTGGSFNINGTVTALGGSIISHGDYSIVTAGFPTLTGPVVITNVPASTAPVANDDAYNTPFNTLLSGTTVLVNDTDADSDPLTAALNVGPTHSSAFTLNSDGTFSYTPTTGYIGTDTFTYHANDGTADSNIATVTINVTAPEIEVWDGATNLTDGTATVNFGSHLACNAAQKTFTVKNIGTANLTLTTPTLPTGFSLVADFGSATLAPATETTFQVKLTDTTQPGIFSGALSFANNDAGENPFNFNISATITNPTNANMQVFMGASPVALDAFSVLPNASTRKFYTQNTGPLRVTSNTCGIASMLVKYGSVSYSELMGFPADKLTTDYWFPYYNNVAMDSQLRVSNIGGASTTITVTYGNNLPLDSYTLAPGAATRKNYAGINSGPLHVTSSASNILTSIRVIYGGLSFFELMGFPANQLTTDYWFPYYNNYAMDSQLRVSNVGGSSTTITVTYGNNIPLDSYTLAAGAATRKNYPGINSGPLHVTSSASNILTTVRIIYVNQGFSELSGFPANQLTKEYTYPVYDNVTYISQLRVSNVGGVSTTITIYGANNVVIDTYTLAVGAATRKYYSVNDGPLHVVSSASNILSTQRLLYTTPTFGSLNEIPGFPTNQITTEYYFPYYNNAAMSSQLRIALPLYVP